MLMPPLIRKIEPGDVIGRCRIIRELGRGGVGTVYLADHANPPAVHTALVNPGPTRGDQVAVLNGLKPGDIVVTSGQLKLHPGSTIVVNNAVQPPNDAAPQPVEE